MHFFSSFDFWSFYKLLITCSSQSCNQRANLFSPTINTNSFLFRGTDFDFIIPPKLVQKIRCVEGNRLLVEVHQRTRFIH
ncbi:hypothetical protein L6452_43619 [Arctium lappa]|uniref:Uncharacterized protein n=1 Tax=Arctium lappa TaxID=4217 RepID=A0ACB8XE52_ARCLA|nr:hypothetical protein L6452_43619 [Arctium lappa]